MNQPVSPENQAFRQGLRQTMIARRQALSAEEHAARSTAVAGHLAHVLPITDGAVLAFCWPVRNEPDLRDFVTGLRSAGLRTVLPVVVRPGVPLAFREWWPEQPLQADRFGIPAPTDGDFLTPDILLLPVNAFDRNNYRLGYGGGFFDRTLAALSSRKPQAIGVGFDFQRVDSIQPGIHDRPLDLMVTESGCQPRPGPPGPR